MAPLRDLPTAGLLAHQSPTDGRSTSGAAVTLEYLAFLWLGRYVRSPTALYIAGPSADTEKLPVLAAPVPGYKIVPS